MERPDLRRLLRLRRRLRCASWKSLCFHQTAANIFNFYTFLQIFFSLQTTTLYLHFHGFLLFSLAAMFQKTFKNFNINFNMLEGRRAFSSGDLINGDVCFDLTEKTKITSITMSLKGLVHVHWSTGSSGGRKRRSTRRTFSAKLILFELKSDIFHNNRVGGAEALLAGTYMYPFTCQIPPGDFPSSFQGVHGKIAYTLTVSIHRPWHLSKEFTTELNFVNCINNNNQELWAPLRGSNSVTLGCLWCVSGPVSLTATLEKKAFFQGETVKVMCLFSNATSTSRTPKLKLVQKQSYFTANRTSQRILHKSLLSLTGEPVVAYAYNVYTEIMLTIPSSAAITISNCSILVVEYIIEVSLRSATVLFPIILYSPVNARQPPLM
ncbi:arrestin domain-containing protein 3-like isoform X2 [Mugil cephalus]|uniref:arrestin domain-containing protein 3-like isoform X2 n=1 Tax=Mugil cephalus TaxID=48193 RepID=UPI001FB5C57C|nr:arrestin domain-containing protein 3-like isoform X2 [Mugil cephalus]